MPGYGVSGRPTSAGWGPDRIGRAWDELTRRLGYRRYVSLYWFTRTQASSVRLYWENRANNFNAVDISLPAAITVFPGEIYRAPRSWARCCYHNLIYFHEVDRGGHFAAREEPEVFAAEIWAAFRSLR
jgi:pimeloyl-ACP methyl ester carboxylesterase